jgi:endonuclease/exonuclease/phosphatase (EEP) superfamily protein YafD
MSDVVAPSSLSPAGPSSPARRVLLLVGRLSYLVVGPVAVLSALRILRLESTRSVVAFETFLPYFLLSAYVALVIALVARMKVLIVLCCALVACHVVWTVPEYTQHHALPDAARTAPKFTLYSHNVLFDNPTPEAEAAHIRSVDADVVFLEELGVPTLHALDKAHAFDAYPYRATNHGYSTDGLGIFSKTPLVNTTPVASPGFPQLRSETVIDGRTVVLWNVHMIAPVGGPISDWKGDIHQLDQRLTGETGDVVVAGDFNATYQHRPFRALLDDGVHDVAMDRGRAWQRTWPANGELSKKLGGFIRIDHVLTKGKIVGTAIGTGPGNGSDHASLRTTFALLP